MTFTTDQGSPNAGSLAPAGGQPACPVNSYNEWDPLEEVIVGRLTGLTFPSRHAAVTCHLTGLEKWGFNVFAGRQVPAWAIAPAEAELEAYVALLQSFGITVRRPDPFEHRVCYRTPHWTARGYTNAFPRDTILVIGQELIEAPMCWRSRYFEVCSFKNILSDYFRRGARWTAAPRPQLLDALYDENYASATSIKSDYVINDLEPVFDAADVVRCGRDVFVTRSNVTNGSGIEWLRRHLGPAYRIHVVESRSPPPLHIDTMFMPLAPGKLLINPEAMDVHRVPEVLKRWDVLVAPQPDALENKYLRRIVGRRREMSVNVLMLDERRAVVEKHQTSMIRALEGWGFEPIPCVFQHFAPFRAAFHCVTLDVRRRGGLQSYL